jgi:hypothetical protein
MLTLANHALARGEAPKAPVESASKSSPSHIAWQSPPTCPSPDVQLNTLVHATDVHPLWGTVTLTQDGTVWRAQLTIRDAPYPSTSPSPLPSTSTLERSIEGASCEEVTAAALLVLSLLQREHEEPLVTPSPETATDALPPEPQPATDALPPEPPFDASPTEQRDHNLPQAEQHETSSAFATAAPPESRNRPTPEITVGAAVAGGLWNVDSPSLGAVLSAGYQRGWLGVRAHGGWLSSAQALQTRESARVHWSAYEAGLRLCATFLAGVSACAGPTLQHLAVEGRRVAAASRSAAWFPGFSAALHGALEREGLGVWGELGVNVRLRRIALELPPRGEVAALERATWYAWFGPQWRWR